MRYYLLYQEGTGLVIGYLSNKLPAPAPWVEVSRGEFISAGGVDPEPTETIETVRATKLSDLSTAGNAAIVAGVDVTLPSTGETEHFALHETDQINLTTALTAVEQAAIQHKLYHTTYCNHLLVWAQRAESAEELDGITYGAELPEDLADNLAAVLAAAGGAM